MGGGGGGGRERELQVNICGSFLNLQVRALQRPPPGVKLVIDAVCIIKGVKPKKVAGEKVSSLRISSKPHRNSVPNPNPVPLFWA